MNRLNRFEYFSLHNTIDISIGNGKGLALPIEISIKIFCGITANIAVGAYIVGPISERFEIKLPTSSAFPTVSALPCYVVYSVRFRQSVSAVNFVVFVNQTII